MANANLVRVFDGSDFVDFSNFADTSEYIDSRPPHYYMHIIKAFSPDVIGEVKSQPYSPYRVERVTLHRGDQSGSIATISDTLTEKGVQAWSGGLLDATLKVHVEDSDSNLFRGGEGGILVGKLLPSVISLSLTPRHGLDAEALAARLGAAEEKALVMVEGILDSNPQPLYSGRYEEHTV